MPHSLRFHWLVTTFGLLVLLGATILYNGNRIIRDAMVENGKASIKQTSQLLNLAISPYASNDQMDVLNAYLSELIIGATENRWLTYIAIGNENGVPLLMVGGDRPQRALPTPDDPADYGVAVANGLVHVRQPLLLADNAVGYVQYGLSTERLLGATRTSLQQGGLIVGLSLLLCSVLVFSLGVPFGHRIGILIGASKAIAEGDYQHIAPEQGDDEIAQLAHHFNLMAAAIRLRISALEDSRAEIERLNAELEQRVAERTRELANSNTALENSIKDLQATQESLIQSEKLASLGSLVAGVAHELNTPIGNALMVATTLEDKTKAFMVDAQAGLKRSTLNKYLDSVASSCPLITRNLVRAADLITSFKHVAVDQTSSQRRQFDLYQVAKEIADTSVCTFKKTPYQLIIDIPQGLIMDSYPGPFGQVLTNLITNALTHAFEGREHGRMHLGAWQQESGHIVLEFSDNGKGIPPDNLKHIFDPFFTTRLGHGGSGLGLNIVHNIVEGLLGGLILVSSVPEQGTRFTITLPVQAP